MSGQQRWAEGSDRVNGALRDRRGLAEEVCKDGMHEAEGSDVRVFHEQSETLTSSVVEKFSMQFGSNGWRLLKAITVEASDRSISHEVLVWSPME
jgi:hypothetical protein